MREAAATEIRRAITGTEPRGAVGVSSRVCLNVTRRGRDGASPCPWLSRSLGKGSNPDFLPSKRAEKPNFTFLSFRHVCGWEGFFVGFGQFGFFP